MGEVYRARDPRLGRDVAVKVISSDVSASPERLRRFEQEARAVAALEHPGILAVHDVGTHAGRAYVVFELLEGETLRDRLARGPIPVRKALELGGQIAEALAAAHAHGVVHRDLKPENLFLVREGHVKLLDFGLARLTQAVDDGRGEQATRTETDRGAWMGTPGYVSPEQLRGQRADARSDIVALGAVLYEMLSGRRAFRGDTHADTLSAILDRDPPPTTTAGAPAPRALDRLLRRCLEKDPADRFQSARDVAFALASGSVSESAEAVAPPTPSRHGWWAGVGLLGAAAVAGLAFVAGRRAADKPPPTFKQLTFRRGWLDEARFAPDGRTIVYGAGWDGKPVELFETRTDSPESRPLGLAHAKVLSISSQGQMAILLDPSRRGGLIALGTLAVVPLAGGTARELLENVFWADWTPDGRDLCVSRVLPSGEVSVELPPGTVRHRTRGWTGLLRVSRDGRYVAFEERANRKVVLVDRDRKVARALVEPRAANFWGLAWGPTGREVWFTEGPRRTARSLYALDLDGRRRVVYSSPGNLSLMDSAPDGRILIHRSVDRIETIALLPGHAAEQDVTVYDHSVVAALSADGRRLLLDGIEEEKGRCVYLRREAGDPVRVAAGVGLDVSPDRRFALVVADTTDAGELSEVPIGPGLPRRIDLGGVRAGAPPRPGAIRGAAYLPSPPGGLIVRGRERPDQPYGLWRVHEGVSKPRRLELDAPGDAESWDVAPDGRHVAVKTSSDTIRIVALEGRRSRDIRLADVGLSMSRWSGDGRSLFLVRVGSWPCEIHRLDLATEKVELCKRVAPPDPTGIVQCTGILPSADGRSYAYGANRSLAALVVAEGLR
jgi:Tol biopolymer transport system component